MLRIADGFSLPLDAVTQTIALMGIRGSGKTHTATVLVEEMLEAGQPVVVYDPTGAWTGLKTSADGKRPGYPVVIFGGERADVPLEETAGRTVARVLVDQRMPAVLDVSLMRKGSRLRFMADFAEELYHRNREALHFVADEAHTIAPQNPRKEPEAARVLGAMEDIILQGRRRGLGLTAISQRPALLNTSIRTQCGTLIAMRVIGPHDLKAIQDWTDAHGTPEQSAELMDSLPTLKVGDGWVWSPAWLGLFKRVHFRQRRTFDSSATPEVGKKLVTPTVVAAIDLDKLGQEIRATVEKAKADDPRELRRRIADLERQAKARPAETRTVEVERVVEVPVLKNGQLDRTEKIIGRLEAIAEKAGTEAAELRRLIQPAATGRPIPPKSDHRAPPPPMSASRPIAARPAPRPTVVQVNGPVSPRQQRFLDAAATLTTLAAEVTRETVAAWLGVHPRGGSVGEELKALADAGLVELDRGRIVVTGSGMAAAGSVDPAEAVERAKSGLSNRQRRFFEVIVAAYPGETTREAIAEQFNIHPRGGSLGEDLGRLVGRGLVTAGRGRYRARDFLFAGTGA